MSRRHPPAALLLTLVCATPAFGQVADTGSRHPALAPQAALPAAASPSETAPLLALDPQFRDQEDERRKGIVRSWEVGENVDLGVGLVEVHHKNPRERRVRTDPMRDVRGPDHRIAAVGLSFRF